MNTVVCEEVVYGNPPYPFFSRDELRRKRNLRRIHLQETKRKIFFLTMSLSLIMVMGVIFGSFMSSAKAANNQPQEYKYFTRYTVSHDETLWDIAVRYRDSHYDGIQDYIDEVKRMNHIENADEIRAGSILLIPYYSSELLR